MQRTTYNLFFIVMLALAQSAFSWDEMRGYGKESWDFENRLSYDQITHRYLTGNQFEKLTPGFSYRLITYDFGVRWTPNTTHGFYLKSQVAQADSATATGQTYSNSSLTQATAGLDWLLYESDRWELIPHLYLTFPFKKINPDEKIVLNSEGAFEAGGEVIARTLIWRLFPYFSLGAIYRDEGRAGLLTYSSGFELEGFSSFWGASLNGYSTISNDEFTRQAEKRERVAERNGSAMNFYAVNPGLLKANVYWKNDSGKQWGFQVGAGTTLTGSNRAGGWNAFVSLNYRFLGKLISRTKKDPSSPKSLKKEKFKPDQTDGVDQELFEGQPTLPSDNPQQDSQVVDINEKKPKAKNTSEKDLEKILNEAQDQVEIRNLRQKKNRK